jgi:hypothetical protein
LLQFLHPKSKNQIQKLSILFTSQTDTKNTHVDKNNTKKMGNCKSSAKGFWGVRENNNNQNAKRAHFDKQHRIDQLQAQQPSCEILVRKWMNLKVE